MNDREERALQELEGFLEHTDPEFVQKIRGTEDTNTRRLKRIATVSMIGGSFLALTGLHLGSAFGGIGILIALAAWGLKVAAPQLTTRRPVRRR
ncbi:Protein of unknown function [Lentzea xinjiangensis]|uniref:DUF3040 domain-containing protein n=1 Tax=Lentzea xinjiangensis TaxID=402600 RepID=A0A1H9NJP4_9PSEU|nr:DUF3040 domain-containing protein [Lentzea xinjiangensis]SER35885.1 Protein of unknown function [Lentzea xinjiangensis]